MMEKGGDMDRQVARESEEGICEVVILNILYENLLQCKRGGTPIRLFLDNRIGSLAKSDKGIFSCTVEHGQEVVFLGFDGDDLCFKVFYATVLGGGQDVEIDVPIEVTQDFDDVYAACRDVAEDPLGWCSRMAQVGCFNISNEDWARTMVGNVE